MRKFGLADGLGIVAVLGAIAYFPGQADPLTYPKLMALAGGGLFLAPRSSLGGGRKANPPGR